MSADLFELSAGRIRITSPMVMDTAAAVLAAVSPHISAATEDCVLDLSAVPAVDSAALSVVLGLLRVARTAGRRLVVADAPAAFDSLAALYGVEAVLSAHA